MADENDILGGFDPRGFGLVPEEDPRDFSLTPDGGLQIPGSAAPIPQSFLDSPFGQGLASVIPTQAPPPELTPPLPPGIAQADPPTGVQPQPEQVDAVGAPPADAELTAEQNALLARNRAAPEGEAPAAAPVEEVKPDFGSQEGIVQAAEESTERAIAGAVGAASADIKDSGSKEGALEEEVALATEAAQAREDQIAVFRGAAEAAQDDMAIARESIDNHKLQKTEFSGVGKAAFIIAGALEGLMNRGKAAQTIGTISEVIRQDQALQAKKLNKKQGDFKNAQTAYAQAFNHFKNEAVAADIGEAASLKAIRVKLEKEMQGNVSERRRAALKMMLGEIKGRDAALQMAIRKQIVGEKERQAAMALRASASRRRGGGGGGGPPGANPTAHPLDPSFGSFRDKDNNLVTGKDIESFFATEGDKSLARQRGIEFKEYQKAGLAIEEVLAQMERMAVNPALWGKNKADLEQMYENLVLKRLGAIKGNASDKEMAVVRSTLGGTPSDIATIFQGGASGAIRRLRKSRDRELKNAADMIRGVGKGGVQWSGVAQNQAIRDRQSKDAEGVTLESARKRIGLEIKKGKNLERTIEGVTREVTVLPPSERRELFGKMGGQLKQRRFTEEDKLNKLKIRKAPKAELDSQRAIVGEVRAAEKLAKKHLKELEDAAKGEVTTDFFGKKRTFSRDLSED